MLYQNIAEAIANLIGSRQRTLLALIGIVIGTGSVIAMINIGTIVSEEAVRRFRSLGTDIATLSSYGGGSSLGREEVQSLAAGIGAIRMAAPIVNVGVDVTKDGESLRAQVVGTTRQFFSINRIQPAQGRIVDLLDGFHTFATVGAEVARGPRDGPPLTLGDRIRIGTHDFEIVGILAPVDQNALVPVNTDWTVFVPMDTTRRLSDRTDIGDILIRTAGELPAGALEQAVASYLSAFRPDIVLDVRTARQLIDQMQTQMRLYTVLLGAIGSIALIVGGVGVMNVMLVSVTERRQEIGIRMALGARRRDIQSLFLIESILLSVTGGILGGLLGIAAAWVFADQTGWTFVVAPLAIPLGAGVSVTVGVFFGFYPAVMASRLNVVEALRGGT
ncbi:ABC transporter permease [Thalassobaculum sp. OXR-137]|uniref:ABC transporter permease n=1 Tax=Thalassobaculum sp. OXR-137 TaxID=3100173 RepID=UPI002AC8FAD4|nr:ABC transporter permease [Thalassobaculum sp. OXR-137]WPZ34011.1 ABC transporter permease [Thalassobaculum sp. OXR-137]